MIWFVITARTKFLSRVRGMTELLFTYRIRSINIGIYMHSSYRIAILLIAPMDSIRARLVSISYAEHVLLRDAYSMRRKRITRKPNEPRCFISYQSAQSERSRMWTYLEALQSSYVKYGHLRTYIFVRSNIYEDPVAQQINSFQWAKLLSRSWMDTA